MSSDPTPEVVQVPVTRYDVNLTLDDILTPLAQKGVSPPPAGQGATTNPELAQHLQTLSTLAGQLKDVVGKINQLDPTVLSATQRRPSGQ